METNLTILQVKNLTRLYHKGQIRIPALEDVTFEVQQGEYISIIGRSGSGKSTLLNLIGGLDTPTSGNIIFTDTDLSQLNRKELAHHRRFSVGIVFQSFNLIPYRSALENVSLALIFGGVPPRERRGRAASLLARVGLEQRLNHMPAELSGGEAQRVAVARALANNPKMLLADEPTGNLDSITSREIIALLQKLNQEQGLTVLMVTHEQDIAEIVSDKIIQLMDGKIINQKTMEQ